MNQKSNHHGGDLGVSCRIGLSFALAGALFILGLAVLHCFYSVPILDDFHFRIFSRDLGFQGALNHYWENNSGRLMSLSLVILIYGRVELLSIAAALILALFTGLTLLACILYVALVFRTRLFAQRALFLGLLLFATYWGVMASPGSSFYWMPTAAQSHPAFLLFVMLLLALQPCREISDRWRWPAVSLLALAFGLTHEWLALLGGFATLFLAVHAFSTKASTARFYLAALPAMAAGLAVVMSAPGVRVRMERSGGGEISTQTFSMTADQLIASLGQWISSPAVLAFMVLTLLLSLRWDIPKGRDRSPRMALLLLAALISGLYLGILGFRFAMGINVAFVPRVLNVLCLGFLWSSMTIVVQLRLGESLARPPVIGFAALIFACAIGLSPNSMAAVRDLLDGTTQAYRTDYEMLHERLREIPASRGTVVLETYPAAPSIYMRNVVSRYPEYWVNRKMAEYYDIDSLVYTNGPPLGMDAEWLGER